MKASAFRIDVGDNVATLLEEAGPGAVALRGVGGEGSVVLVEKIELGHKVALADIAAGEPVRKFGVVIGMATCAIPLGGWVHLHNCRSRYDIRSASLDPRTGAATDMVYE